MEKTNEKKRLVREIIMSGFFTHEEITILCGWLGFNDTAFRDKSPMDKLDDYLLLEKHKYCTVCDGTGKYWYNGQDVYCDCYKEELLFDKNLCLCAGQEGNNGTCLACGNPKDRTK